MSLDLREKVQREADNHGRWQWPARRALAVSYWLTERRWMGAPLAIALGVRLAEFLMVDVGARFIVGSRFPGAIAIWRRFDAGWYAHIAQNGYAYSPPLSKDANFFPLFPLLESLVGHVIALFYHSQPYILAGLLVSWVCFAAACVLLFRMVRDRFDAATAYGAVVLFATFSFGFYYGVPYSESLYMLLAIAAFAAFEQGHWGRASIAAALASATRPPGLLIGACVVLAYALDWWRTHHKLRWDVLWLALTPMGTIAYLLYSWVYFHNPLQYKVASQAGWGGAQIQWTVLHAGVRLLAHPNYLLSSTDFNTLLYSIYMLFAVLFLVSLVAIGRKLGPVYLIYSAVSILTPLITFSYPTSIGRYLSVVFPTFIVAAYGLRRRPALRDALAMIFAAFLALFALVFALNYPIY